MLTASAAAVVTVLSSTTTTDWRRICSLQLVRVRVREVVRVAGKLPGAEAGRGAAAFPPPATSCSAAVLQ